jgi:hypothetical protein
LHRTFFYFPSFQLFNSTFSLIASSSSSSLSYVCVWFFFSFPPLPSTDLTQDGKANRSSAAILATCGPLDAAEFAALSNSGGGGNGSGGAVSSVPPTVLRLEDTAAAAKAAKAKDKKGPGGGGGGGGGGDGGVVVPGLTVRVSCSFLSEVSGGDDDDLSHENHDHDHDDHPSTASNGEQLLEEQDVAGFLATSSTSSSISGEAYIGGGSGSNGGGGGGGGHGGCGGHGGGGDE